jgi:hypothetical protein
MITQTLRLLLHLNGDRPIVEASSRETTSERVFCLMNPGEPRYLCIFPVQVLGKLSVLWVILELASSEAHPLKVLHLKEFGVFLFFPSAFHHFIYFKFSFMPHTSIRPKYRADTLFAEILN